MPNITTNHGITYTNFMQLTMRAFWHYRYLLEAKVCPAVVSGIAPVRYQATVASNIPRRLCGM